MDEPVKATLLLESPSFICGHCQFTTNLSGRWHVENGRLVFMADEDPQPRRGPSVESCCESYKIAEFTSITADDGHIISGKEFKSIQAKAGYTTERQA